PGARAPPGGGAAGEPRSPPPAAGAPRHDAPDSRPGRPARIRPQGGGLRRVARPAGRRARPRPRRRQAHRPAAAEPPGEPARQGSRLWASGASAGTAVAYLSVGEFGDQGDEEATVWSGGREVLSGVRIGAGAAYFRDQAGFDLGDRPIDLERHRGEDAEKWAAAGGSRP